MPTSLLLPIILALPSRFAPGDGGDGSTVAGVYGRVPVICADGVGEDCEGAESLHLHDSKWPQPIWSLCRQAKFGRIDTIFPKSCV